MDSDAKERVESLKRIVELAIKNDCGGASVAQQLLLGVYDASEYPFDLTELGRFDPKYFEDAINVIRLRVQDGMEPHEFFTDGSQIFKTFIEYAKQKQER